VTPVLSPRKDNNIQRNNSFCLIVTEQGLWYYFSMRELKKNQIFTVEIEGYSSEGMGVCRIDGRAVFVPGTIEGELWELKLVKVTASAIYARAENCLRSAKARKLPRCPHFSKCGGCDTWHMSYEEELRFKLNKVNNALTHIGKQTLTADEIIGSDSIFAYRNKGILAVDTVDNKIRAGFYRQRTHELIPAEDCLIQNELCRKAAHCITAFMEKHGIAAYDENTGKGAVRHIFCRKAHYGTDALVCIVSAKGFGTNTSALVDELRKACPELSGIVLNINKNRGNTVLAGDFYTLWGKAEMSDTLCGIKFEIAPQAFYQINPPQAEKLYMKALEYAKVGKNDTVLDLYCGAGTISLCLAREAGKVIGAEIVPEAILNAGENAKRNGIENAEFICADAGDAAAQFAERGIKPRVIVVDPPRKGMGEAAVQAVASMNPERIVYVSCNCATLARDILRFNELGYTLDKVTAVDMFPRTCHVECVACLRK